MLGSPFVNSHMIRRAAHVNNLVSVKTLTDRLRRAEGMLKGSESRVPQSAILPRP